MTSFSHLPQIGPTHAALKDYVAYRDNLHGNPERLMPIEGLWAHSVAIKLNLEIRTAFICPELLKSADYQKLAAELSKKAQRTFVLSQKAFEKISDRDGPSGIASIVRPVNLFENDFSALQNIRRVVVMDAAEVPGNIGTMLRTLDGLGSAALVLTNKRVRLTHPKVVKGSLGAIFTVPVVNAPLPDTLAYLQKEGFPLFAADSSEKSKPIKFSQATAPERFCLVLGSEKYGLPKEIYDAQPTCVSLPMTGTCDSLNVSIAGSILLYGLVYRKAL